MGEGADQSEAQERNPRVAQTEFGMSAQEARTCLDNQRLARIYADAVRDAQVPTQAAEVSPPEPLSAELVAVRKDGEGSSGNATRSAQIHSNP